MADNNPGKQKLNEANQELSRFEEKVLDIAGVLSSKIKEAIEDIKDETSGVANIFEKKITKEIKNLAKDSDAVLRNIYKLKDGTAKTADIQKQLRELNIKNYGIQRSLAALQEKGIISAKERKEQEDELTLAYKIQKDLLEGQVEEAKKLQSKIGLTGAALKGMSKIPFLRDAIDTRKALEAAAGASTRMGATWAAFKSVVGDVAKSLIDPVTLITLTVSAFKKLVEIGVESNKQVIELGKSMAINKDQAREIRDSFQEASGQYSDSLNEILINDKARFQSQKELAEAFGATRGFTEQQLRDQVYLTKQIGLSVEEATELQQISAANGLKADQVVTSTVKQTAALFKQKGIQLDNRKVLGEVAKVSGQLRLQYQNNPDLIAKAVVQTQKLGMSLQQAADASKKLLNFEESIEAELTAELLTGKDINLERARLLRLNGDVAGAMEVILSEVGDINEFMSMNTLQQDAIANLAGMTTDEYANHLVQEQKLNNLGKEAKKQIEDKIKLLEKEDRTAEANKLRNSIGNAEEAKAALDEIDAQTKFNALVEKLQRILVNILDGPVESLVDKLTAWLSNTENINKLTNYIKHTIDGVKVIFDSLLTVVQFIRENIELIVALIAIKMVAGLRSATTQAAALSQTMASTRSSGDSNTPGGMFSSGAGRLIKAGKEGGVGGFFKSAGRIISKGAKANALTALTLGGAEAITNIASGKDASETIGRSLITGLSSLGGGIVGSLLLGPGAGTIGGGIAGGMLGDKIGDWVFDKPKITEPKSPSSEQQTRDVGTDQKAESMLREQQKTNELLHSLANKEGVVRYDSDMAGKVANINSYTIQ